MKKKFSKERFYRRRAYQIMGIIDKALNEAHLMLDEAIQMKESLERAKASQNSGGQPDVFSRGGYIRQSKALYAGVVTQGECFFLNSKRISSTDKSLLTEELKTLCGH